MQSSGTGPSGSYSAFAPPRQKVEHSHIGLRAAADCADSLNFPCTFDVPKREMTESDDCCAGGLTITFVGLHSFLPHRVTPDLRGIRRLKIPAKLFSLVQPFLNPKLLNKPGSGCRYTCARRLLRVRRIRTLESHRRELDWYQIFFAGPMISQDAVPSSCGNS